METEIIRVEDLHFAYNAGTAGAIPALAGISLSIRRGEWVAIVGHNGSGKSTLARHFNAVLTPTRGRVTVDGMDTADPRNVLPIRQRVGMVFQDPDNQIVGTVVEEDVAFGPENLGVPRQELRRRVRGALEAVGMWEYRHRAPHLLSGGQKQRVAIAGALAMEPACLVLDESTSMLDPAGRADVLRFVQDLHAQGVTIVIITHFMEEAVLADRIIVLEQGRMALEGTPAEVFAQRDMLGALRLRPPAPALLAYALQERGCLQFEQIPLTREKLIEAVLARLPAPALERG